MEEWKETHPTNWRDCACNCIHTLILRRNIHFTDTLVRGVKGLQIVKDWELVKDCIPAGTGGNIMELEDAANAEELSKVREEKTELRVSVVKGSPLKMK